MRAPKIGYTHTHARARARAHIHTHTRLRHHVKTYNSNTPKNCPWYVLFFSWGMFRPSSSETNSRTTRLRDKIRCSWIIGKENIMSIPQTNGHEFIGTRLLASLVFFPQIPKACISFFVCFFLILKF